MMNLNNLLEEITSPEAKKKFRELLKKYHPDIGGSTETTKKIVQARHEGEDAIFKLYKELTGKKIKKPKEKVKKEIITELLKKYVKWADEVEDIFGADYIARYVFILVSVDKDLGKVTIELRDKSGSQYIFDVAKKYPTKTSFVGAMMEKLLKFVQRKSPKQQEPKDAKFGGKSFDKESWRMD